MQTRGVIVRFVLSYPMILCYTLLCYLKGRQGMDTLLLFAVKRTLRRFGMHPEDLNGVYRKLTKREDCVVCCCEKPRPCFFVRGDLNLLVGAAKRSGARQPFGAQNDLSHFELCSREYSHNKCHLFQSSTPQDLLTSSLGVLFCGWHKKILQSPTNPRRA